MRETEMTELKNITIKNLDLSLETFYGQNINPMIFYTTEKLKSTIGILNSKSYFRIATYNKVLALVKLPDKIYNQNQFSYDKRNYKKIDKADFLKWLQTSQIKLIGYRKDVNKKERAHIADLEVQLLTAIKENNSELCEKLYWDKLQNYMNSCLTNTDFATRMINIYFDQINQIS